MQESDQKELPSEEQPSENTPTQPTRHQSHWGILLVALLALILSILSLFGHYFSYAMSKKKTDQLAMTQQQWMAQVQPKFQQLESMVSEQQKMLTVALARSQSDEKRNALLLGQEAEYLLNMARYSLLYDRNLDLAAKLVAEANSKMEQMNDPGSITLRRILNDMVTAINATPNIDIAALVSHLAGLSDQVSALSSLPVFAVPMQQKTSSTANLTWKERLMTALHSLREVITIRRLPEPVVPLPSLEQQAYVIEGIRLQLLQAEWAVLHQNPQVYQAGLERARTMLQKYYARNPTGAKIIQEITELEKVNIKPPVPDLTNTINMLHSYLQNFQQSASSAAPPPSIATPPTPPMPPASQEQINNQPKIPQIPPALNSNASPPRVLPS